MAWYSIEVFDGGASASLWAEAHADTLTEVALTNGADDWTWEHHSWGVSFEVHFASDAAWEAYCALAAVRSALDAVPDPVTGLLVYKGRGGTSGSAYPRKPRPLAGCGAAALPLPWDLGLEEITSVWSLVGTARPALVSARA